LRLVVFAAVLAVAGLAVFAVGLIHLLAGLVLLLL